MSQSETVIREAPKKLGGILKELGPGLIIAGSVVGSGELIATTVAGAEAGFYLLWVILIGCFIKVFVQLEIGKFTILTGKTTLSSLGQLKGWKPFGLHWIAWFAMLVFLGSIGQMGGVVGGVGQALTLSVPITEKGKAYNEASDASVKAQLAEVEGIKVSGTAIDPGDMPDSGPDTYIWAFIISIGTAVILYLGKYRFIEKAVTIFVVGFTIMSVVNVLMLQGAGSWAISWSEFTQGLKFQIPPKVEGIYPLATALAAFGIIGMAAGELIFYPYWCLEKGYAKFVGPREDGSSWEIRAHGWIRVMKWDAWCSMVIYTISTVAFYLLGAAVLGRAGLHPEGMDMIRTLSAMYEPVFGEWAVGLFLIGAVMVLYSTFFVNNASSAYVWSDAVFQIRGGSKSGKNRYSLHKFFCVALPLVSFVLFYFIPKPKAWIIFAGMMQTLMLPLLGYAAIRFRFDVGSRSFRIRKFGDIMIFVSAFGLCVAGGWLLLTLLFPEIRELG
ncbi:MAG: Nramp family divalent metal transporter [Verrucomicrobia bacterium]|nr:Nramp family divalent metal transporter [Verrucomicrobiota bacterium]MDA1068084.1 Nramp family divalent metal transporter [Verrucomicrobiota bacterium]